MIIALLDNGTVTPSRLKILVGVDKDMTSIHIKYQQIYDFIKNILRLSMHSVHISKANIFKLFTVKVFKV